MFFVLSALLLFTTLVAQGANPLVPRVGMADPNLHFFNGSFLMFATHDYSVRNTGFDMRDWWCWKSQDLVKWEIASVVKPQTTLHSWNGNRTDCWATDGAFRNNMYYFYLSVGGAQVAVVRSSSPAGHPDHCCQASSFPTS